MQKKVFLVSYPRSGNTLLRKYFSILQGRAQSSVYEGDVVSEAEAPLTLSLAHIDLIKSHQMPAGHEDVVYLIRDGRNAILSFLYMKFLFKDHQISETKDVQKALRYVDENEGSWTSHVKEALLQATTRRILFVKYEDMIHDPATELMRIGNFLAIELPRSVAEECVRREKLSTTYQENPFNGFLYSPGPDSIYAVLQKHRNEDYWRHLLDAPAMKYFHDQGATEMLLQFGYEQSADWWQKP